MNTKQRVIRLEELTVLGHQRELTLDEQLESFNLMVILSKRLPKTRREAIEPLIAIYASRIVMHPEMVKKIEELGKFMNDFMRGISEEQNET